MSAVKTFSETCLTRPAAAYFEREFCVWIKKRRSFPRRSLGGSKNEDRFLSAVSFARRVSDEEARHGE
jgi:hypothetical protein